MLMYCLYLVQGGFFFLSALFGWFIGTFSILNAKDKRNKSIAVGFFMGINVLIIIFLGELDMVPKGAIGYCEGFDSPSSVISTHRCRFRWKRLGFDEHSSCFIDGYRTWTCCM
jgi:hypothetical protein